MKKNIIASILESIGLNAISFVMKLSATASYYVWWFYLILIFATFIGFLLLNIGIDVSLKRKTSNS